MELVINSKRTDGKLLLLEISVSRDCSSVRMLKHSNDAILSKQPTSNSSSACIERKDEGVKRI